MALIATNMTMGGMTVIKQPSIGQMSGVDHDLI